MRKIKIDRMNSLITVLILIAMIFFGCATVKQVPFEEGLTKQSIREWRRPDRVSRNPGKYNADEMWIYEYPDSSQMRYYFKNEKVVGLEEIVYENP